jgi:hypothetical protein
MQHCHDESDDNNSEDGERPCTENENYRIAVSELQRFEGFKLSRYRPKLDIKKSLENKNDNGKWFEIEFGPVVERGKDLPSGKNVADYLDARGRMDLLCFFSDHQKMFPNLFIIMQREASWGVTEVSCERFFGLSGYVSSLRRSMLGVRNYERLALLASNLPNIYVDPQWVADEYLRRCKAGAWKKDNTIDSLKCFNLERILDAEMLGRESPPELSIAEYVNSVQDNMSSDYDCGSDEE